MPLLRIYVDDSLERFLQETSKSVGRSVEELAEAAIENAAIESGYRKPSIHWTTELQLATNGN